MSDTEKGTSNQHYDRQVNFAPQPMRIANPGALGLFSFASTTFILSLYNVNARGVAVPNVVVGMACFCGGLAQLLAGMWEFPLGYVFFATVFICIRIHLVNPKAECIAFYKRSTSRIIRIVLMLKS